MSTAVMLASDFDGTLRQGERVSEEDLQSIIRFRGEGNRFGIVTGRSHSMLLPEIERYGLPLDFLIANTGAVVWEGEKVVRHVPMPREAVRALIRELDREKAAMYGVSDKDRHGLLHTEEAFRRQQEERYPDFKVEFYPEDEVDRGDIVSFFIHARVVEETEGLYRRLSEKFRGVLEFHLNNDTVDATAAGITKGDGVRWLKEYYGLDTAYVIGDDYNDISMIRAFHGFAVSGGKEETRRAASMVFDRVGDCVEFLLGRRG